MLVNRRHVKFPDYCQEPTDTEFINAYSKHSKSFWFLLIFYIACLPPSCTLLLRSATTASGDFEITCLVPNLINNTNWTLSAIRKLTMPIKGKVCTYIDFNYTIFERIKPSDAYKLKKKMKKPQVKSCSLPVTGENLQFDRYPGTFLGSCIGYRFKEEAKKFRSTFHGVSYIVWGILADIFGRKSTILYAFAIYGLGMLLSCFANSFYLLLTGFSIEGIGSSGINMINIILFMELCHASTRGSFVLLLMFYSASARILGYILKSNPIKYMNTYCLYSIPGLTLLFYAYYMPESPLWLLSFGKKRKAWKILECLGQNIDGLRFLPEQRIRKMHILFDNFKILFRVKKYRRTIFIMSWIKSVKFLAVADLKRYVKVNELNAASHKFLMFMSEIMSLFVVLPPFIILGRYASLYLMFLASGVCLVLLILMTDLTLWYTLNVLSAQYFYSLEYITLLYSAELLPTSARGTGVGIVLGSGKILSIIWKAIGSITLRKINNSESFFLLSILVVAVVILTFLPNLRVGQLPDWKRSRRDERI